MNAQDNPAIDVTLETCEARHVAEWAELRAELWPGTPECLQQAIDMGLEAGMASTLERLDELLPTLKRR